MRKQRGIGMLLVLIFLGVGGLLLPPTLRHVATALNFYSVSRESAQVEYALDAVTQQALWLLEYEDSWADCVGTPELDSFAACVVSYGSWDLATDDKLENKVNETEITPVNGQQVEVSVEVPGAIAAATDPTPTPTSGACFYATVDRTPAWVEVGEPIRYRVNVWNCSTSPSQRSLRHVAVITSGQMSYVVGSTDQSVADPVEEPNPPTGGDCTTIDTNTETAACPGYAPDSLLLSWPSEDVPFGAAGNPKVQMAGGSAGTLRFEMTPNTFGIFYVEVVLCYFNVGNPCAAGSSQTTGKVAPVVAGMFNIQGTGKGHAYGASSKLDSGGSELLSEQPQ